MPKEFQPLEQEPSTNKLLEALEESQRKEVEREIKRRTLMEDIAKWRWHVAQNYHRNDRNQPLDFRDRLFQKDIYLDTSTRCVIMTCTQIGKSELLIVTANVMAASGLRVFYVMDTHNKRDRVVAARIDPALQTVPLYKRWVEEAKSKGRSSENMRLKHIGDGFIYFVGAETAKDFYSHSADVIIIDEYQLCNIANIEKADNRTGGSEYRYKLIVGNPRERGSASNPNLAWEYENTDQRQWHIPCDYCKKYQVLGWWTHIVREERNRMGGVVSVKPLDEEWKEGGVLDMRPICMFCQSPMNRLTQGMWIPTNPDHKDHGYQLSNLYNVNKPVNELYALYRKALHNPALMSGFHNDQLGLPYSQEGDRITIQMLDEASTGRNAGLDPYEFDYAANFKWKELSE